MKLIVPPPLQGLICAGLIWVIATYFPQYSIDLAYKKYLSGVLFFIGVTIDLLALRIFHQSGTTVSPFSPDKTSSLVATGIYRYTRNPMYLGMVFLLVGFTVWFGAVPGLLIIALFIWSITELQIKPEEAVLLEKFGESYTDYCQKVRRWI